jgi:hypothetical protein
MPGPALDVENRVSRPKVRLLEEEVHLGDTASGEDVVLVDRRASVEEPLPGVFPGAHRLLARHGRLAGAL